MAPRALLGIMDRWVVGAALRAVEPGAGHEASVQIDSPLMHVEGNVNHLPGAFQAERRRKQPYLIQTKHLLEHHVGSANTHCRAQRVDCVWKKRKCRKRPWAYPSGATRSLRWRQTTPSNERSCPQLAHAHLPFAHTPPRWPRCQSRTPAAQLQRIF
jgi:hypothetical protein